MFDSFLDALAYLHTVCGKSCLAVLFLAFIGVCLAAFYWVIFGDRAKDDER